MIGTMFNRFAQNSTGTRDVAVFMNGGGTGQGVRVNATNGAYTEYCVPFVLRVKAGDVLQLRLYQNSGAALNSTQRYAWFVWIPD